MQKQIMADGKTSQEQRSWEWRKVYSAEIALLNLCTDLQELNGSEMYDKLHQAFQSAKEHRERMDKEDQMQKAREEPCCVECGETEKRVLTQSRGKGVWSCWDCDNRAMQEEDNRAIACGNHGSCFA